MIANNLQLINRRRNEALCWCNTVEMERLRPLQINNLAAAGDGGRRAHIADQAFAKHLIRKFSAERAFPTGFFDHTLGTNPYLLLTSELQPRKTILDCSQRP